MSTGSSRRAGKGEIGRGAKRYTNPNSNSFCDLLRSSLAHCRLTDNELRKWKFAQEKDERRFQKQNAMWEKAVELEEKAAAKKKKKKGPIVYGRPVGVQVQVGGEKLVGRTEASVGGPPKTEEILKQEQEAAAAAAAA